MVGRQVHHLDYGIRRPRRRTAWPSRLLAAGIWLVLPVPLLNGWLDYRQRQVRADACDRFRSSITAADVSVRAEQFNDADVAFEDARSAIAERRRMFRPAELAYFNAVLADARLSIDDRRKAAADRQARSCAYRIRDFVEADQHQRKENE